MTKMIMAVIPQNQADLVLEGLARSEITATYTESRGGVMHQSKRMLFIAVEQEQVMKVIDIIRANITPSNGVTVSHEKPNGVINVDMNPGGTVIFCWELTRMETF